MSTGEGHDINTSEFEDCWHDHIRRVVAYAERHVGRDASYDIAQATFLTAWRSWRQVPEEPLPWLISVARGHVRNLARTQRRQDSLTARLAALEEATSIHTDPALAVSGRREALEILAAMPLQDREALLLVAWDGLSTQHAASVLGCRPGTLRMRLHRARRQLEAVSSELNVGALHE